MTVRHYRAVVIGASAGGLTALLELMGALPAAFALPMLLAQHLHRSDGGRFAAYLDGQVALKVREASDKERLEPGHLFTAPANYHLLVEPDGATLALSTDPKVNWARPSIDVLFESAARAFGDALIAVILSGASDDGARGMAVIQELGGRCVAQDPATAESPLMPRAAIDRAGIETALPPAEIGALLGELAGPEELVP